MYYKLTITLKNPKCKLFLCTSCPCGDTDVTDINDVIFQFCQENKIICVDINTNVTKQKFAILASISKFKYLFNKLVLFKCECNFHLFFTNSEKHTNSVIFSGK